MDKQNAKTFMIGSLVGGVIGAVTALLFAPKPGRELRSDIVEGYHTVSEKTQEIARSIGSQTSEFIHKAKDAAIQVVENARSWNSEELDELEDQVVIISSNEEYEDIENEEVEVEKEDLVLTLK